MKKYFVFALNIVVLGTGNISAQASDKASDNVPTLGRTLIFKVNNNPSQEKTDQFEIQSLGGTTFTASNTTDGSTNSYKHSLQIIVGLIPANKSGNNNFQLNFYSSADNIQQAATYNDGTLNIYYPVTVYDAIRTKLEQAFAARKKVMVKVIQKPNGYREGTLIL